MRCLFLFHSDKLKNLRERYLASHLIRGCLMIIAISGPDGVGKSSIVTFAWCPCCRTLSGSASTSVQSSRLMLLCVFLAVIIMRKYDWGGLGYHEYSGKLGRLYIGLLCFDFLLFKLIHRFQWRKYYPHSSGENLILDRYLVDVICDAIVATDNARMVLSFFSKFVRDLESTHRFLIVTCDHDEVLQRRPDVADDKVYLRKMRAYKLVSKFYKIAVIDTSNIDLEEAIIRAKRHLTL